MAIPIELRAREHPGVVAPDPLDVGPGLPGVLAGQPGQLGDDRGVEPGHVGYPLGLRRHRGDGRARCCSWPSPASGGPPQWVAKRQAKQQAQREHLDPDLIRYAGRRARHWPLLGSSNRGYRVHPITKRQGKRGVAWVVSVSIQGKRIKRSLGPRSTRAEAKALEGQFLAEERGGVFVRMEAGAGFEPAWNGFAVRRIAILPPSQESQ